MESPEIKTFFKRLQKNNKSPTTELIYNSNFQLLISVILSAQSTDKEVNKVTKDLFAKAKTPTAILKLGESDLRRTINRLGLFNTKAANIMKTCRILKDQHNEVVPETREELEALPGVGRKTANVVLNTAFGHETMAVDTHIFRVSNRTGLAPGKNVLEVEHKLLERVPKPYRLNAHHWLILHGRYICVARKPLCDQCPVNDICEYPAKSV
ncbi:MAG: endonuclease III [Gammaproteobacteria bacterium]|nr:endonuclease III [Gammaproteobacteria bacterium]